MQASREGMRTLWLSLGILGLTAVIQAAIVAWSGSVRSSPATGARACASDQ